MNKRNTLKTKKRREMKQSDNIRKRQEMIKEKEKSL